MAELLIPKPQPSFPYEDVHEVNAQIFSQMMFEPVTIETIHTLAEQQVAAFQIGHQTLKSLGYALYMDTEQQAAFSYGATMYEVLSTTVRPVTQSYFETRYLQKKVANILSLRADPFSAAMAMRDEEELLHDEAPVTAQLMEDAALLQPQLDRRIVVMGAALERSIDKDTIDSAI